VQLVGALDDAPSKAKFLRFIAGDPASLFSRAYVEAFRTYLDEKKKEIHNLDFLQIVALSLTNRLFSEVILLFATWYNQYFLEKKAAKILSGALQKSTAKGLEKMYQKYVDEEKAIVQSLLQSKSLKNLHQKTLLQLFMWLQEAFADSLCRTLTVDLVH
jgi:hypothetical protein